MGRRQGARKRTLRSEAYGKGSVYQDNKGYWWYQPPAKDGQRLARQRYADEQSAKLGQADHLAQRTARIDHLNAPTVQIWLGFWLNEHVAPDIKPKTLEWYTYLIETYILPAIGEIPLLHLTSDHLIKLQNQLRARLGNRTVARIDALLARALKKAVVSRKIMHNPMEAIDAPRVARSKQEAMTVDEVGQFREGLADARLELLYDLALLQGLRRGELLGLLISEYDRARGTIKVSGQVQTIGGVTARQGSPKSENSIRELPLTPRQQGLIERHLARLQDERLRFDLDWKEHGLLFPSEHGTPMIPRNLSRHYYQSQKRAGIDRHSFHTMRHTAATRLDAVKASPAVTAAILGHGPASVTGGYIHVSIEEKRAALLESERVMLRRAA